MKHKYTRSAAALLLALCLLLAGCSEKTGTIPVTASRPPEASNEAAGPGEGSGVSGDAAAAAAKFDASPGYGFDLSCKLDYAVYGCRQRAWYAAGTVQRAPFAVHADYCMGEALEGVRLNETEEYVSVFGDGSMSSLFSYLISARPDGNRDGIGRQLCEYPAEYVADWYTESYPLPRNTYQTYGSKSGALYQTEIVEFLLHAGQQYAAPREEQLEGRDALRLDGVLTGRNLVYFCQYSNLYLGMAGGVAPEDSAPMTLWIARDTGLPLRLRVDVTALNRKQAEQILLANIQMSGADPSKILREAGGNPDDLMRITETSLTLDLRYDTDPISLPVPLPAESERMVAEYVTASEYRNYALAKHVDRASALNRDPADKMCLMFNTNLARMEELGTGAQLFEIEDVLWLIRQAGPGLFTSTAVEAVPIGDVGNAEEWLGTCDVLGSRVAFRTEQELPEETRAALQEALNQGRGQRRIEVSAGEETYVLRRKEGKTYDLCRITDLAYVSTPLGADFEAALEAGSAFGSFQWNGSLYALLREDADSSRVYRVDREQDPVVFTTLRACMVQPGRWDADQLRQDAISAILAGAAEFQTAYRPFLARTVRGGAGEADQLIVYDEENRELPAAYNPETFEGAFTADGRSYTVRRVDGRLRILDETGAEPAPELRSYSIVPTDTGYEILDAAGDLAAQLIPVSVVSSSGENKLPKATWDSVLEAMAALESAGTREGTFRVPIPENCTAENPDGVTEVRIQREATGEYQVRIPAEGRTLSIHPAHESN